MKIIITAKNNSIESEFDERFGRAQWFCIYDTTTTNATFLENKNKDAAGGAGTKTAETMAELEIEKVVSGHFGPKAKELLEKLKIEMVEEHAEGLSIMKLIQKHK